MPKTRIAGGIALVAATAVGCGVTTASHEESPLPSEPTMIDYVDPSRVFGLSTQTMSDDDPDARHVHAVYPTLTDAPRLNERLRRKVAEELDRFTGSTAEPPGGTPPAPEFNVDWQLSAVSPEVIGVRLRIGTSTGSRWSESRTTIWYDRTDKRALDSTGLLKDPAALNTLTGLVRSRLAQRSPETDPSSVRPDPKMFDSLGFNPRGELVVEFDDRQVAPESLGRVAVALPRSQTEGLLSTAGLRARRAALRPVTAPPPAPPSKEAVDATNAAEPPAASSLAGSVDCAKAKCVALTYEDGPGSLTGRLLDILTDHNARATFFCLGSNASVQPELLRRMSIEGHLVANQTWSHRDLTTMSPAMIADQLTGAQREIIQATGQAPTLMRPPYGATDSRVASVAGGLGLAVVRWNVDIRDERDSDPRAIADRVVSSAEPGAIVLLHDVHSATVDATPEILRRLTADGYSFVTVPELYGARGVQAGKTYDSGNAAPALDEQPMP
ncbi:polysaccharide deacetylase family protein [Streptosporangium lutulentum]|uniref:Peptidoglycan/xylan/chitin deacetylase (PgdA/CDA1 family) n=1 Tax=Streptosporangium lutulentum TaxID=1461250 RepID=A0ABT9QKA6_9ACTN|nr:polysaccharide deacetylase family protein [Streptosporangium lutulentum]MDP9847180.1 peptidoglycan/xylan/chitin deacetylase (PgdA/CDA1 family) [Streptosporangium lutulentum]